MPTSLINSVLSVEVYIRSFPTFEHFRHNTTADDEKAISDMAVEGGHKQYDKF